MIVLQIGYGADGFDLGFIDVPFSFDSFYINYPNRGTNRDPRRLIYRRDDSP